MDYVCLDCGDYDNCYRVHDEVWKLAVPDYEALKGARRASAKEKGLEGPYARAASFVGLCFVCLAKRLGREVTIDDFTRHPINESLRFGFALGRASLLLGPVVPEHRHEDGQNADADGDSEQHT